MKNLTLTLAILSLLYLVPTNASADALEGKKTAGEIIAGATDADWRILDQENLLYIKLARGTVIVELSSALAQNHVAQIRALARENFYDGLSFYRVIDGFVAQGGDVFEKRNVETAQTSLTAEFEEALEAKERFTQLDVVDGYADSVGFIAGLAAGVDHKANHAWHLHCTGALAMARNAARDTGSTEFYITLQPQRYLDRNLTVFGRVVEGMEYLQALRRVEPAQSEDDDLGETILTIRVGSDLPEEEQKQLQMLRADTSLFADYVEARKNRASGFFYHRPDHVDICQLPIPVEPVDRETE